MLLSPYSGDIVIQSGYTTMIDGTNLLVQHIRNEILQPVTVDSNGDRFGSNMSQFIGMYDPPLLYSMIKSETVSVIKQVQTRLLKYIKQYFPNWSGIYTYDQFDPNANAYSFNNYVYVLASSPQLLISQISNVEVSSSASEIVVAVTLQTLAGQMIVMPGITVFSNTP